MRLVCAWIALALLAVAPLPAQQPSTLLQLTPERPGTAGVEQMEALAARARALPPEFAADGLLRLAERVGDPEWRIELVEEAFRVAAGAQQPFRKTYQGSADSAAAYRSQAFDFEFDALSLRVRAVNAMLGLNRRKALALMRELPPPQLPPLSCKDLFVYHVADYYDALLGVVERGFTEDEKRRDLHIHFLEPYVSGIHSPQQIGPVAELLVEAKLENRHFADLLSVFSAALAAMRSDSRSFGYEMSRGGMMGAWLRLGHRAQQNGLPPQALFSAARGFLIRHVSGSHCEGPSAGMRELYLNELNRRLASLPGNQEGALVPFVRAEEIQPGPIEAWARPRAFWTAAEPASLRERARKLRVDKQPQMGEAQQALWLQQLQQFLADLDGWSAGREDSAADYFHQKALLYETVLDIVPAGELRATAYQQFLNFLNSSGMQQESRIEWFWHANYALQSKTPESAAAIERTTNSVLMFYRDLLAVLEGK